MKTPLEYINHRLFGGYSQCIMTWCPKCGYDGKTSSELNSHIETEHPTWSGWTKEQIESWMNQHLVNWNFYIPGSKIPKQESLRKKTIPKIGMTITYCPESGGSCLSLVAEKVDHIQKNIYFKTTTP